jgi:hypothetical protein
MINLLPTQEKREIRAARINVLLVRYNLIILLAIAFLFGAMGYSYYYLTNAQQSATEAINENAQKEGTYATVKTEADSFRAELSNAKSILDGQTSYAKAALNIARLLPEGTALNDLKLNEQSFGTPLILTVNVANEQAASQLIKNFKESPFFTGVTKNKISVGSGSYPYIMEISVTMSKEAAK